MSFKLTPFLNFTNAKHLGYASLKWESNVILSAKKSRYVWTLIYELKLNRKYHYLHPCEDGDSEGEKSKFMKSKKSQGKKI
jgi:hypothetical protein